jgi:hypothetical protein
MKKTKGQGHRVQRKGIWWETMILVLFNSKPSSNIPHKCVILNYFHCNTSAELLGVMNMQSYMILKLFHSKPSLTIPHKCVILNNHQHSTSAELLGVMDMQRYYSLRPIWSHCCIYRVPHLKWELPWKNATAVSKQITGLCSHNTEHFCHMLVGRLPVMWAILYLHFMSTLTEHTQQSVCIRHENFLTLTISRHRTFMWNMRFSEWQVWRWFSSGMLDHIIWQYHPGKWGKLPWNVSQYMLVYMVQ